MSLKPNKRAQTWRDNKITAERDKRQAKREGLADQLVNTSELGDTKPGRVISQFGANLQIEDELGQLHLCMSRRNVPKLVCGDQVRWCSAPAGTGVVVERLPRKSVLSRPNYLLEVKAIAANIDQIFVVIVPKPELDEDLINRYLIAAELTSIKPVLVINKIDLLDAAALAVLRQQLQLYEKLDYSVLYVSTRSATGLVQLTAYFQTQVGILVGQSGVGKSSLVKALLPDQEVRIGALSEATGLGKHTTTTTVLYSIGAHGGLIDSPGVREFGLGHVDAASIGQGFVEFQHYLGRCKFTDCRHRHEPGCAIKTATNDGLISPLRYQSYLRIVDSLDRHSSNLYP